MKRSLASISLSGSPACHSRRGFTLIELLVVIAIIALLAAMVFPIVGAVNRSKIKARAKAELGQIQTALESYKQKLGHYPPDNTIQPTASPAINQLYYELLGTRFDAAANEFVTLDGSARISAAAAQTAFGTAGFVNSTKGGGDEEGRTAKAFLTDIKVGQFLVVTTPQPFVALGTQLEGPLKFSDSAAKKINPWRYVSSNPTNNPNSYDLWIDVLIDGKTNRICNWSQQPLIVFQP